MGFEPQAFRPTVRRANHCATGAGDTRQPCLDGQRNKQRRSKKTRMNHTDNYPGSGSAGGWAAGNTARAYSTTVCTDVG